MLGGLVRGDKCRCDAHASTAAIDTVTAALARPVAAVLFTGDTSSAVRNLERDCALRVVSKPMNADEMLNLLQELLRQGPRLPLPTRENSANLCTPLTGSRR